jgi:hypothetical protein
MATSDIKKGPLYVDSTNNRVGVGTASPDALLEIESASNTTLRLFNTATNYFDIENDSNLKFNRGGSELLRIQANGGISFNGDTAAANALDDYEEGTWTPVISYGAGSSFTTITSPTVALGAYRKIGSLLYITFYTYKNSSPIGGSGGTWRVEGFPFAILHGSNTGYASIPTGYWSINGTNYFNSIPTRWQANGSTFLDMYGAQATTAWSSGNYEVAGHGVLMTS